MATRKHGPSDAPAAPTDEIEALRRAIVAAAEENWAWHNVPEAERARFRPDVAAIAREATSQLRAEHLARSGGQP